MIHGYLSPEDEGWAHDVGMQRQAEDVFHGRQDQHGMWNKHDGAKLHVAGARAECFAARAFDVEWDPKNFERRHEPDVGDEKTGFDVRSTTYKTGGLLLYPDDPDSRPAVLVIVLRDEFMIPGWIVGADGKQQKFWWKDAKDPCFRVPQSALNRVPDKVLL